MVESGNTFSIETFENEYRNLMVLLKDKFYLDLFGECGGMGRCATCLVRGSGIRGKSALKNRNEPATLSKIGCTDNSVRLACQLLITHDLDGAHIEIFPQE